MNDHASGPMDAQEVLDAIKGSGRPPWQIEAVKTLGLATVLCLAMGYMFYSAWNGDLRAIQDAQAQTNKAIDAHVEEMRRDRIATEFYLRSICLNTADTENERAGCVPPGQAR